MLISANPDIANYLNNNVLPAVALRHCRADLDQYIIFWSNIMQGSSLRVAYPNIKNTLKSAKLKPSSKNLSEEFHHYERTFFKMLSFSKKRKSSFLMISMNLPSLLHT